jgi:hypothetical protein
MYGLLWQDVTPFVYTSLLSGFSPAIWHTIWDNVPQYLCNDPILSLSWLGWQVIWLNVCFMQYAAFFNYNGDPI